MTAGKKGRKEERKKERKKREKRGSGVPNWIELQIQHKVAETGERSESSRVLQVNYLGPAPLLVARWLLVGMSCGAARSFALLCSGLGCWWRRLRLGREVNGMGRSCGWRSEIAAGFDAEDGCGVSVYEFFGSLEVDAGDDEVEGFSRARGKGSCWDGDA